MDNSRVAYRVIRPNVVEARIEGCSLDAFRAFNDRFMIHSTSALSLMPSSMDDRFLMQDTFISTATCLPGDAFSWEEGKKIALSKLSEKYNKSLDKHLANMLCAVDASLTCLNKYFEGKKF